MRRQSAPGELASAPPTRLCLTLATTSRNCNVSAESTIFSTRDTALPGSTLSGCARRSPIQLQVRCQAKVPETNLHASVIEPCAYVRCVELLRSNAVQKTAAHEQGSRSPRLATLEQKVGMCRTTGRTWSLSF